VLLTLLYIHTFRGHAMCVVECGSFRVRLCVHDLCSLSVVLLCCACCCLYLGTKLVLPFCMYVLCINSFGPCFSLSTLFSVLVVVNFKVAVVILSSFILHTHSPSFHFSVFLVIEIAVAAAVIQKKHLF